MGLPYSPLCDRHTVHVAESQIGLRVCVSANHSITGFIDFIVEPTMVVCGEVLNKMVEPLVSLPPSDSLLAPSAINGDGRDGGSSSMAVSPTPD